MAFVYNYVVSQREYNHEYAREKGLNKRLLLDIYKSEDRAYSEEKWYFLNQSHYSCNLFNRIHAANVEEAYRTDDEGYELPDLYFDDFLEVSDVYHEDDEVYRTYFCRIKTTLQPREFKDTLYPRIINSTHGLLAGLCNRTGVQKVEIELEGDLSDYEYDFEKVSDTPVVIKDKAYFQMKCKKSGKEVLKEIDIMK